MSELLPTGEHLPAERDEQRDRLDAIAELWLASKRSELTRDAYRRDIARWFDFCEHRGWHPLDVRSGHVNVWIEAMREKGNRERSIARRLSAVSSFCTYLVNEELLTRNPVAGNVSKPNVRWKRPVSASLSNSEVQALAEAAEAHGARSAVIVHLLASLALRISELTGADVEDMRSNAGHRTLTVTRKGGDEHELPLSPRCGHFIDMYLAGRASGPLVATRTGRRVDRQYVTKLLRSIGRRAGLGDTADTLHPHMFRHAAATNLSSAGVPTRDIQLFLGHTDSRTTEVYLHNRLSLDNSPAYRLGQLYS